MSWKRTLVSMVGALALASVAGAQGGYKVVVNDSNPHSSLSRTEVSRIFLKKTTTWSDGAGALPVDLDRSSRTRRAFSQGVHGKSPDAVAAYWQTQVFSGRGVPPVVKSSDQEVLAYVRTQRGAIGYVSAGASLGANVRVLKIVGAGR